MGDQFARPRFDLVVNVMTANMVKDGSLTVNGGDQMRPLLHVKDIARIILAACMSERRDTYNLARYNIRIDELARLIRDTLGYGEIKMAERENLTEGMDARDYSVCTSKFDRDFQMDYFYSIERAVAEIAHVISTRRIKNHKNPIFNNMLNIRERLSE
jgi:nucleoside-diphosphate-sugar epimerase